MTTEEWMLLVNNVTDQMKEFTRPFVTPIVHQSDCQKPIFGSGTYLQLPEASVGSVAVLTCEHVARNEPLQHQPLNCPNLLDLPSVSDVSACGSK